jgi:hypothetical protein
MVWEFLKKINNAAFVDVNEKLAEFHTGILNQPAGAFGETPSEIDRQHMLMLAYLCHLAYVAFRSDEEAVREALIAPNTPIGLYRTQALFFPGDEPA